MKHIKLFENFSNTEEVRIPVYEIKDGKPTKDEFTFFTYVKLDQTKTQNIVNRLSYINDDMKKDITTSECFYIRNSSNVFIFRTFDRSGVANEWNIQGKAFGGWFIGPDIDIEQNNRENKGLILKSDIDKLGIDMSAFAGSFVEVLQKLGYWVPAK